MAKGNARHLPLAIAAAVVCLALVQAGQAFVSVRAPPSGAAAPLGAGVRYATGAQSLAAPQGSGPAASAWGLAAVALLAASGARLALRSTAAKADRRAVRVHCGAAAAPFAPVESSLTTIAAAPAPVAPAAPAPTLIDLEAEPLPSQSAFAVAEEVQPAAAPALKPSLKEEEKEAPAPSAFPSRVGPARFVGATRHSQCHGSTSRSSSQRAARRAVGAKLQERFVVEEVPEPVFDPSRLRLQIQVGLCAASLRRSERGRESKTQSASKCATATTDARIKEDDCLEERRQ